MAADAMETLAGRYTRRAVRSVFTYTREAHPGENYRHHTSMDDKRSNARAFRDHSHIRRRILLDDLAGTAHRAYGLLPNMTWIIGPGGFIHYKSSWISQADVENTLEAILDFQTNRAKNEWVAFYRTQRLEYEGLGPIQRRASAERPTGRRGLRTDAPEDGRFT